MNKDAIHLRKRADMCKSAPDYNPNRPAESRIIGRPEAIHATILLAGVSLFHGIALPQGLAAVEHHVEGTVERRIFKEGAPTPIRAEAYTFVVDYSQPLWRVKTRDLSGRLPDAETAYDGTNFLTYFPRKASEFKAPITTNTFLGMAYVNRHSIPHTWFRPEHSAIWLAFCASDTLRTNNGLMTPLFLYDHLGADFQDIYRFEPKLPVKVEWSDGCEATPADVKIYHDGKIRGWESLRKSWVAEPEAVALPAPFQAGYILSHLKLDAVTNVGGTHYAQMVSLTSFGRVMKNPDPQRMTFPLERFTIQATNWTSHALTKRFQPELAGRIMVTENRFEGGKQPVYTFNYAANRWLDDEEVKRLPEYKNQLNLQKTLVPQLEAKKAGRNTLARRALLFAGWLALTAMLCLGVIARRNQSWSGRWARFVSSR
jgi:hypothetical protein